MAKSAEEKTLFRDGWDQAHIMGSNFNRFYHGHPNRNRPKNKKLNGLFKSNNPIRSKHPLKIRRPQ